MNGSSSSSSSKPKKAASKPRKKKNEVPDNHQITAFFSRIQPLKFVEEKSSKTEDNLENDNKYVNKQSDISKRKRKTDTQVKDEYSDKKLYVSNILNEELPKLKRPEKLNKLLKDVFGLKEFREGQLDIINATLDSKDCLVIMPTGGGKSLTYQLPSLISSGISIIISPLLALIQNQVNYLQSLGIEAATINSSITLTKKRAVLEDLRSFPPKTKILFVTPELMATDNFKDILINLERSKFLNRLIVDEAHCISEWGFGFRNDYTKLGWFKYCFPHLPVIALTATANDNVKNDIVQQLRMSKDFKLFTTTFSRPNLYYEVRNVNGDFEKMTGIKEFINSVVENRRKRLKGRLIEVINSNNKLETSETKADIVPDDNEIQVLNDDNDKTKEKPKERAEGVCGIVYCHKRSDCDDVANFLVGLGLHAESYHAGLTNKKREEILKRWCETTPSTVNSPIDIVVATISFGMGIDKRDVRFVCHWTIPKTMEGYYQESGRAGRDGKVSRCLLFYSNSDKQFMEMLLESENARALESEKSKNNPSYKKSKKLQYDREKGSFDSLVKYCESLTKCRHSMIVDYFTGTKTALDTGYGDSKKKCAHYRCDVCQGLAKKHNSSNANIKNKEYKSYAYQPNQTTEMPYYGVNSYNSSNSNGVKGPTTNIVESTLGKRSLGMRRIVSNTNGFMKASKINSTITYGSEDVRFHNNESEINTNDNGMDYGIGGGIMDSNTRKKRFFGNTTMDSYNNNSRNNDNDDDEESGFMRKIQRMKMKGIKRGD